ncbi:MAG: DUF368 domain-containing protein [Candidatus Latescibacterota bacterium]|nr:DUF368 domain-containing protein [Candidatus Latescibacterota bacterium]
MKEAEQSPYQGVVAEMKARGVGLMLRGIAMGTADVIPGVSGGTIALITGIYDELVGTIAVIDGRLLRALVRFRIGEALVRINAGFLVPLLAGIFTAVVTLAKAITFLLAEYPTPVWGALTGLIVASLLVVVGHIRGWNPVTVLSTLFGIGVGYGFTVLVPMETGTELYKFLLSGSVASVAMILPGISGSFLLVILGKYQQVFGAIAEHDLIIISVFGGGFVFGILLFSRVLKWLLARFHSLTMAFLVGLMAGSLGKVWPFRAETETGYECVLPVEFGPETVLSIALMLAMVTAVMAFERYAAHR